MKRLHEDDAKPELISISDPVTVKDVIHDLNKEYGKGSWNCSLILAAYFQNRLFGLKGIPCLCVTHVKRRDVTTWLWVHKEYRSKGYATLLLKLLSIRYTTNWSTSELRPFYEARGITIICGVKMPIELIMDVHNGEEEEEEEDSISDSFQEDMDINENNNDTTIEEPESIGDASSEEEDDVKCDSLRSVIAHKVWLLSLVLGLNDIGYVLGYWVSHLYYNDIEYRPINENYWDSTYGIMSPKRVATQLNKRELDMGDWGFNGARNIIDSWYGQFIRGFDHIVRNKTMCIRVLTPLQYDPHTFSTKDLSLFLDGTYLTMHSEYITARNMKYSGLIVLMDSGINSKKAIEFAKSLDYENKVTPESTISSKAYPNEYCTDCHVRACNVQYTGNHGCYCRQSVICDYNDVSIHSCDCDCHCDIIRII